MDMNKVFWYKTSSKGKPTCGKYKPVSDVLILTYLLFVYVYLQDFMYF